jgi:hypothetical protein
MAEKNPTMIDEIKIKMRDFVMIENMNTVKNIAEKAIHFFGPYFSINIDAIEFDNAKDT